MDFEKLSAERYSLRKFDTRPVEQEKLDLILEAGRHYRFRLQGPQHHCSLCRRNSGAAHPRSEGS